MAHKQNSHVCTLILVKWCEYYWKKDLLFRVSGDLKTKWTYGGRKDGLITLHQFSSIAQSCWTFCDPMACRMPGFPVHHQLPEYTQTHVHLVGDAIQPCHPLSSPSPPAFNLSQHQALFKSVSSLHQVAKVLEFQLQHQSFQWYSGLISFRMDWLDLLAVQGTPKSSPTPQFKSINSSALSFFYSPVLTSIHNYLKKHSSFGLKLNITSHHTQKFIHSGSKA